MSTEEERAKRREYQKQYYDKHKEHINAKKRANRAIARANRGDTKRMNDAKELMEYEKRYMANRNDLRPQTTPRAKPGRTIDEGKVMALLTAGWKVKDIAWDMGFEEADVYECIRKRTGE